MYKLLPLGRILFGLSMIGLAALCIINKDFIIGRPPQVSLNPVVVYLCATGTILASIGVIISKKGYEAALAIAVLIVIFSISRHIPVFMNDWGNGCKSLALMGGTLIIASSFRSKHSNPFILTGCIFLAVFFIACAYAHIIFYEFVQNYIPDYIPFHGFFTYFTAAALIVGGIGLLIPVVRKWAAFLSGIMVGGWFLLLHIPRFIINPADAGDRMGLFESLAFTGIFFVIAALSDNKKEDCDC